MTDDPSRCGLLPALAPNAGACWKPRGHTGQHRTAMGTKFEDVTPTPQPEKLDPPDWQARARQQVRDASEGLGRLFDQTLAAAATGNPFVAAVGAAGWPAAEAEIRKAFARNPRSNIDLPGDTVGSVLALLANEYGAQVILDRAHSLLAEDPTVIDELRHEVQHHEQRADNLDAVQAETLEQLGHAQRVAEERRVRVAELEHDRDEIQGTYNRLYADANQARERVADLEQTVENLTRRVDVERDRGDDLRIERDRLAEARDITLARAEHAEQQAGLLEGARQAIAEERDAARAQLRMAQSGLATLGRDVDRLTRERERAAELNRVARLALGEWRTKIGGALAAAVGANLGPDQQVSAHGAETMVRQLVDMLNGLTARLGDAERVDANVICNEPHPTRYDTWQQGAPIATCSLAAGHDTPHAGTIGNDERPVVSWPVDVPF